MTADTCNGSGSVLIAGGQFTVVGDKGFPTKPCPGCENCKPWGHKVTMHIYIEGDISDSDHLFKAVQEVDSYLENCGNTVDLIGLETHPVQEEPDDQVAT